MRVYQSRPRVPPRSAWPEPVRSLPSESPSLLSLVVLCRRLATTDVLINAHPCTIVVRMRDAQIESRRFRLCLDKYHRSSKRVVSLSVLRLGPRLVCSWILGSRNWCRELVCDVLRVERSALSHTKHARFGKISVSKLFNRPLLRSIGRGSSSNLCVRFQNLLWGDRNQQARLCLGSQW